MKLFVWDFHGVLEKDNEYGVIEISNTVLKSFGYKERFKKSDNSKVYGRRWYQYFEYLLPNEPKSRHLDLETACVKLEAKEPHFITNYIRPSDYSHYVLKIIAQKHDQILISNMHDTALQKFMALVKVDKFFKKGKAFSCNSQNKKSVTSKKEVLKNYLENKHFDDIVIVGDSPWDIELSEVAGGVTYLYSHPGLKFKDCNPTYRINDLREILKEV